MGLKSPDQDGIKIPDKLPITKTNGITEGFHRKMKLIQRRAYGIRNFENHRLRIRVLCVGIEWVV